MSGVDADIRHLAAWLESSVQEVTDAVDARLHDEVPEYFAGIDPSMADAERASVVANLRAVAHGLRHGRALPDGLPPGAVDEALLGANEGLPWDFSLGQNASAASALLKVHERTVGYRLATIEERIGASDHRAS